MLSLAWGGQSPDLLGALSGCQRSNLLGCREQSLPGRAHLAHLRLQLIPRALGLAPNGECRRPFCPQIPRALAQYPASSCHSGNSGNSAESLHLFPSTTDHCLLFTQLSLSVHWRIRGTQGLSLPLVGHQLGGQNADCYVSE